MEACLYFIQLGDGDPAIEFIQTQLIIHGYLNTPDKGSLYDERTREAVIRFQQAYELSSTGIMDDATLAFLLWEVPPEELDQQVLFSNGDPVWIPSDVAIRRHLKSTCSNMHDPRLVSDRNAAMMDMQPCGRCNRQNTTK